ncbi:ABC transporter permease [Desulfonatronovibrio hydrogenovorans]|uniref:ABC transporter permease n=1 Tax=Desulfonatronovibrio hydrogenovorans TaxID=53245 RepID=UPI00048AF7B2|nr:ABC transporter permease [Desulfonatronovibrio hydrogenovorans]
MILVKRLLAKILWLSTVFFGITVLSFWIIHLAPGSPTDMQTTLSPTAGAEARERLEKIYGLDDPVHIQYANWVKRIVKLDFGQSLSGDHRPVWDKIKERLPLTLSLNIISLVLILGISIPIGVFSALYQGGWFDRSMTILVFIGFAMPSFWLALLLMMALGIYWPVFPISGVTSLDFEYLSFWGKVVDLVRHLTLPVFVFTITGLAGMSRFMRTSMLEVLRQDYILTARAKGLPTRIVVFKHAMRNALMPVITILGLSVPTLIGGSVIVESIFSLPGLGQLFYQSVLARDYPLIMGNLVLVSVLTLAGNLLADLGYALADPRIRLGAGRA